MLEQVKLMLGITDGGQDGILSLMISDATQAALSYCHISALPPALEPAVRGLVAKRFERENSGSIAAVKRGDTQVTYAEPIGVGSFDAVERAQLNAFRRLTVR